MGVDPLIQKVCNKQRTVVVLGMGVEWSMTQMRSWGLIITQGGNLTVEADGQ